MPDTSREKGKFTLSLSLTPSHSSAPGRTGKAFEITFEVSEDEVKRFLPRESVSLLGTPGMGKSGFLQQAFLPSLRRENILTLIDGLLQQKIQAPEEKTIILYGKDLTLQTLKDDIPRLVKGIEKIQRIIDEIKGIESKKVVISKIEQRSPISISLGGAAEAIDILRRFLIPWQRKHYREISRLEEREKQVEIELKQAEILERRARAVKERREAEKLLAEATKQREEAERLRLENNQLRLALEREKIKLAIEIVKEIAPDLPEEKRLDYVIRILSAMNVLTDLDIEAI